MGGLSYIGWDTLNQQKTKKYLYFFCKKLYTDLDNSKKAMTANN